MSMSVCEAVGCTEETVGELCRWHLKNDIAAKRNNTPRVPRKPSAGGWEPEPKSEPPSTASCFLTSNAVEKQEGGEMRCKRCDRTFAEVSDFIKKRNLCQSCYQTIHRCEALGKPVPEFRARKKAGGKAAVAPKPSVTKVKKEVTPLPRAASPGGAGAEPPANKEVLRGPAKIVTTVTGDVPAATIDKIIEGINNAAAERNVKLDDEVIVSSPHADLSAGDHSAADLSLTIDFKKDHALYEQIKLEAEEDLRTPEMQLLYFLRTAHGEGVRLVRDKDDSGL